MPYDFQTEGQNAITSFMQNYKGPLRSEIISNMQGQLNIKNIANPLMERYQTLNDPNSQFYRTFQDQIRKNLLDTYSTNKLIGGARARGLSMAGSGIVAKEQREALESRVNDLATNASQQFYLNMTGQASNLLSDYVRTKLSGEQLLEQRRQFDESQSDFGDFLTGGLSYLGGQWLGKLNPFGGK